LDPSWWPRGPTTPSAYDAGLDGMCRDVFGTDGTQFPAFPEEGHKIWLFVTELCRTIWLDFIGNIKIGLGSDYFLRNLYFYSQWIKDKSF